MKKDVAIVIVLLSLIIGVFVFGKLKGYNFFSKNKIVNTDISIPNHAFSSTPITSDATLSVLDYSTSTSVISNSTPDMQWLTYTNKKLGFSIDYPKGVDVIPENDRVAFGDLSGQYPWYSGVTVHQDDESINQFFKLASLGVSLPDKLALDDRLAIDHEPAIIFHESGSEADINRTAVVSHDNKLFEIDINSYYDTTTKIILNSFRFLK
jgi:hypothetical protein